MVTLIPEIIVLLTQAPQLIANAQKVWSAIMTLHAAGAIKLAADQLAAMKATAFTLDADIAAMESAFGPKPAATA